MTASPSEGLRTASSTTQVGRYCGQQRGGRLVLEVLETSFVGHVFPHVVCWCTSNGGGVAGGIRRRERLVFPT